MKAIHLQALFGQAMDEESGNGTIAVATFPFVVGRHRESDLSIANSGISRRHCRFTLREGRVHVEDLGSLNGTFVNEELVLGPRPLRDGDVLRLAGVIFRVHAPATADAAGSMDAKVRDETGRQVLVVDDDVATAETLALLLKQWGHDVRVAHDGPTALRSARDHPPDAVLMDVRLPGMDGFQVARRMREEGRLENALVVAITGDPAAVDDDDSSESAVQQLLIKPVAPETLREVIARS